MSMIRAFIAEPIKYRRSPTTWLAFGVPALFLGLVFLYVGGIFFANHVLGRPYTVHMPGETDWHALVRLFDNAWQVIAVPFGLAILGTLSTQMMHSSRMWPVAVAQPVSRAGLYLAQLAGLMGVVLGGMLLVGLGYLVIGLLFGFGPVDWQVVLLSPLLSWVASFGALAIQTWLGTRFHGFALPITIGVGGAMGSMFLRMMGAWFLGPWGYSYMVHPLPGLTLLASLVVGLVFTVLGVIDFSRQDWV